MPADLPELPDSYFEGGKPQSHTKPGDEQRELIHEIRNLNTALSLLREVFFQLLPALESLTAIDERLRHQAGMASDQDEHDAHKINRSLDGNQSG